MMVKNPSSKSTMLYRDDNFIHDFDRMCTDGGLSLDMLVDEVTNDVNVSSTYTSTRHHGIDPNLLARK